MTEFAGRVGEFCRRYNLLPPAGEPVGVGLSGGADSVALLRVLAELGVSTRAYHCNFHLRGAESDRDEEFCRRLCRDLGVRLSVKQFDVDARRRATGESVEMACRELRYGWWRSLGLTTLAVAHHADDNAETLLLNLMRGSGVRGLKGMLPKSGGFIIRPFLGVDRADIETYLRQSGQDYVTDSTNASTDFRRNRVRHGLLPALEELFPGGTAGIKRSLECLRDNYELYEHYIASLRGSHVDPGSGAVTLQGLSPAQLYELMSPVGFNMDQCREVLAPVSTSTGRRFEGRGVAYAVDRGVLYPVASTDDTEMVVDLDEAPFELSRMSPDEFRSMLVAGPPGRDTMFLDATVLAGSPRFTMRRWRAGDRLEPFGMRGSKLVSDLCNDAGIGAARRGDYPLLMRGGLTLWVCGLRASRHFSVTPRTREVIMIKYKPI